MMYNIRVHDAQAIMKMILLTSIAQLWKRMRSHLRDCNDLSIKSQSALRLQSESAALFPGERLDRREE